MDNRKYESLIIFDPGLDEGSLEIQINKVKEILANEKAEVVKEKVWGRRRFAYTIKKKDDGHYYYIQFNSKTNDVKEFDRRFKLNESIIRFGIYVHKPYEIPDLTRPKLDKFSVGRRRIIPREIIDVSLENLNELPLDRYVSDRGKIIPRRITRISSINQRRIARMVKVARFFAIIPYIVETYR